MRPVFGLSSGRIPPEASRGRAPPRGGLRATGSTFRLPAASLRVVQNAIVCWGLLPTHPEHLIQHSRGFWQFGFPAACVWVTDICHCTNQTATKLFLCHSRPSALLSSVAAGTVGFHPLELPSLKAPMPQPS